MSRPALALLTCALGWYLLPQSAPRAHSSSAVQQGAPPPDQNEPPQSEGAAAQQPSSRGDTVRALVAGRVQDAAHAPVSGASVCAVAPELAYGECTITDSRGRFALEAPGAEPRWLYVSREGYLSLQQRLLGSEAERVLTLQPGGLAVTGSVVDAVGGPIAGALVRSSRSDGPPLAVAVSNAEGRFSLSAAPEATHIGAQADGYSQLLRELPVPASAIRLVLGPASAISGRVLAETPPSPLPGVTVSARNLDGPYTLVRASTSEANGSFSLRGLSAGRYALSTSSPHWRGAEHHAVLGAADEITGLELTLRAATQVVGEVRVEGGACGSGRAELHGAVSLLVPLAGQARVVFDGVLPGRYRVEIHCSGALPAIEQLEVGAEPLARTWRLTRGLLLAGMAQSSAGAPLAQAQILVQPVGDPPGRGGTACQTDERGEFTCSGLEAGTYECWINSNMAPRSNAVRIALSPALSPRLVLRADPESSLRVRLTGADRYDAAALQLFARRGAQQWLGERQGQEVVFDPLPLGSYRLEFADDAVAAAAPVELTRPGELKQLTLTLPAPHVLAGRVVGADGQGLPDVWVHAAGGSLFGRLRPIGPALTDADGLFSLPGILPGRYTLSASSGAGEARLDDVASDAQGIVLRIARDGSISGEVRSADGSSVSNFRLRHTHLEQGWSDESLRFGGAFELPWLAPGHYRISAHSSEGAAEQVVELAAGAALSVVLQLGTAASQGIHDIPLVQ